MTLLRAKSKIKTYKSLLEHGLIVIGLTGGIASGKTTVSRLLAELGAVVLDADKVGHEALAPGSEAYRKVVAAFGTGVLRPDGSVDRKKLGEIVFNDAQALAHLNRILHPYMYQMIAERLEEHRRSGTSVVVLEAAVLLEAGWTSLVDQIWVTQASEDTAIQRLGERNSFSAAQAQARIRSQLSPERRSRQADIIINTDCPLAETECQVRELWRDLRKDQAKEKVDR